MNHFRVMLKLCALTILLLPVIVSAANVNPTGYTNDFSVQPAAADWPTLSISGAASDSYDLDADVNARIVSTSVTTQPTTSPLNPVGLGLRASWSSSGLHLATRPNGNRYSVLVAKLINNTGSNATGIAISYLSTIAGNANAEDAGKGTRVYYSMSGESNSWINLASLNSTATNGSSIVGTNLDVNWPHGSGLYLLWADDNAAAGNDVAYEIDNFSLRVTGSTPLPVRGTLIAPAPDAVFVSGTSIRATASVIYGRSPYVVSFWTNSGAGNSAFNLAGTASAPPYELNLGTLAVGIHNIYATIADQNGSGDSFDTTTNTFAVVAPLEATIASPAEGAVIEHTENVIATAAISGGTTPYSVQFFLNGLPSGQPVTSPPYERDFGTLPIGDYTLRFRAVDAMGWTSNSLLRSFRVMGPLSASLTPADGSSSYAGQSLILSATLIGGEPPYTVSFFTNGQLAATLSTPPFTVDLGALPEGRYTASVQATDSSVPVQQFFVTNVITILPIAPAVATHAVQISLDGLGAKYLEFFVTNAPLQFPNFVRLMAESSYTLNARCDYDISETVPNHATMFTARPVFSPDGISDTHHHGFNNNFPGSGDTLHISGNDNVPYKVSMFDVAHDFGLETALYTGKTRLSICERSYNETNGAPDLVGVDNGRDKIDFSSVADVSGANISNEVNLVIADLTSTSPRRYSFIHIAEPDLTGHSSGWRSANWSNSVRMVDAQIGRLMAAIDGNPLLSNHTALIITADHGGGGVVVNGHTEAYHITNYTIPFFVRAPGIPAGRDLYTVLANRGDPGTNRTDYTTQPQPIRNGDASNLALHLLGLPPIGGSFMVPVLGTSSVTLSMARFQGHAALFWSDPAAEYLLEETETLGGTASWQTVTGGIETNDTTRVLTITNAAELPARFFRLRKLSP